MQDLGRLLAQVATDIAPAVTRPLPRHLPVKEGSVRHAPPRPIGLEYLAYEAGRTAAALDAHPLFPQLVEALIADTAIGTLLKEHGPWLVGGSIRDKLSPGSLPARLIQSAVFRLNGAGLALTPDNVADAALTNLDSLRSAAVGGAVQMLTVAGFGNFSIPRGTNVQLPWGNLHQVPAWVGTAASESLRPASVAVSWESEVRIVLRHGVNPDSTYKLDIQTRRVLELFPLAVFLALRRARPPRLSWVTTIVPWSYWSKTWAPVSGFELEGRGTPISSAQLKAVGKWSQMVETEYRPQVRVAVVRALSAAAERQDSADVLIDAVTAWENLVGTGQEVTFRVSSSLALLLERRAREREKLQRELRDIYQIRSRVVHGDRANESEVAHAGSRAVGVARDALRRLFSSRPGLLPLASEARSNALILGVEVPKPSS